MARTYYFADVFTRSEDDRETIDELLDAGFPGTTEVDVVSSNYYTSSKEGMTMGIANRIYDVPKSKPQTKGPSLELGKIIVGPEEHFYKVHDFNRKTMLVTLFDVDTKEWKDITLTELQKNFTDPDYYYQ